MDRTGGSFGSCFESGFSHIRNQMYILRLCWNNDRNSDWNEALMWWTVNEMCQCPVESLLYFNSVDSPSNEIFIKPLILGYSPGYYFIWQFISLFSQTVSRDGQQRSPESGFTLCSLMYCSQYDVLIMLQEVAANVFLRLADTCQIEQTRYPLHFEDL
jgi:hypothetical protein